MQDELLLAGAAGVGIEFLRFFGGAESRDNDRLRLTPAEQRRTMHARKQSHFATDRTHRFKIPTIKALALFHDQATHRFFLEVIERVFENEISDFFSAEFLHEL